MSGCFCTTPINPLHNLMAIPPMEFTAQKLVRSYADHFPISPPHTWCTPSPHTTLPCRPLAQSTLPPPWTASCLFHRPKNSHSHPEPVIAALPTIASPSPPSPDITVSHVATQKCLTHKAAVCPVLIVYSVQSTVNGFISAWVLQSDRPHRGALPSTLPLKAPWPPSAGWHSGPTFQSNTGHYSWVDILIPSHQVINHVRELGNHPLLGIYAHVYVLLSQLSWDSLTHPPWDYIGLPPIGPTLVICDMLSVVWMMTICLSALVLFLWIVGRRCMMNGKLGMSLLQELATLPCHCPNGNRPPPFICGTLT
jgi:hypothetical protein